MLEINDNQVSELQQYADSGVQEEIRKQKYPALQLNQYKGLQPNTPLHWCFSEESYNLIPDTFRELLKLEQGQVYFSDEEPTTVYKPCVDLRFIPLNIPKIFKVNKTTKEVSSLSKFEPGDRSVAKLFLLVLADDRLLIKEDEALVVTLKLVSFKTEEIIGRTGNEDGTLKKLSSELLKRNLGVPGKTNVHFSNIKITPTSKVYKSKKDGETNRAATYFLEAAKLNTPDVMKAVVKILENENLLQDILDPFELDPKKRGEVPEEQLRETIKGEIFDFAQQLGWKKARIKQEIQEVFGANDSHELSIDQLVSVRNHIESLVKNFTDEIDVMPF